MNRIGNWNSEKRNSTVAQFKRLLGSHRDEEVKHAVRAGHSLRRLMANAEVRITGVDDLQMDRFVRRFAVKPSLRAVMFAVATSTPIVPEVAERCGFCTRRQSGNKFGCRCQRQFEEGR